MNKLTRDVIWNTVDGKSIPIRCLTDTHLANIIAMIKPCHDDAYPKGLPSYHRDLLAAMLKEARIRKLSKAFLDRAPIPWQDIDGKWKHLVGNKYEVIGR